METDLLERNDHLLVQRLLILKLLVDRRQFRLELSNPGVLLVSLLLERKDLGPKLYTNVSERIKRPRTTRR